MKKFVMVSVVVLVAALAFPGVAFAGEAEQGQVVFGGTFTLESGEVLEGDLVIFGGSAELQHGSIVDGDVLLFGGNAEINGEIMGDLALLGGNADLGPSTVITGDVVTLGGNVHRTLVANLRPSGETLGSRYLRGGKGKSSSSPSRSTQTNCQSLEKLPEGPSV